MTVCHLWVWKTLCSDDSDLIGCLEDIYQSPRSWPCLPVNTSHLISAQNPCHMSNTDSSKFAKYGPKDLNLGEMGTFVVHLEYYQTHVPIQLCYQSVATMRRHTVKSFIRLILNSKSRRLPLLVSFTTQFVRMLQGDM